MKSKTISPPIEGEGQCFIIAILQTDMYFFNTLNIDIIHILKFQLAGTDYYVSHFLQITDFTDQMDNKESVSTITFLIWREEIQENTSFILNVFCFKH